MASAVTYKEFDINALDYGKEMNYNNKTGSKSVSVAVGKGMAGSNDAAHKIRFQMGIYDTELLRAPFGVSKLMASQDVNTTRRDLDLSIDNDELLNFLRRFDERNLQAATENSNDWFKKSLTREVLQDRFKPIVKEPTKAEYRPTAKTKIIVDAQNNNTQIFMVTKETPSTATSQGKIDSFVPATMQDIRRGCKVIAIVESNGLWFSGMNQFGLSLIVTHILVWPTRQTQGIEIFSLPGGVPKQASTGNGYLSPVNGMYEGMVEEEMVDA